MLKHITTVSRTALSAAAMGLVTLPGLSGSALADDAELAELVAKQSEVLERQSKKIDALQSRLSQLESEKNTGNQRTNTGHGANFTNQEVAGTSQDTASEKKEDASIETLQRKVAKLEASRMGQSRIDWSDGGPEFISADGNRRLQIGGRIQLDGSTTSGSSYDDTSEGRNISGTQARRLGMQFDGTLSERINYKLAYDLANNGVSMRDAYISSKFKLGEHDLTLYLGNKYDDRTLDGATSSNKTWFMERNFVREAIEPDRGNYGLGIKGKIHGDSRTWHSSFAITNGGLGDDTDRSDTTTYMSRAHWNPWHSGSDMLHLGGWAFYEDFDESDGAVFKNINAADGFNDNVTIRSRLLSDPSSSTAYGLELATSLGSFAASAEYGKRTIDQRDSAGGEQMDYDAYSFQTSYFLTGEHHGYSRKSGLWRLPEIKDPVSTGGLGAFQLAARYQALDFNDTPDYPGGDGNAATLGLNWYPNDWSRVMLNYTHWNTHNRSGSFEGADDGNTLSTRVQVIF